MSANDFEDDEESVTVRIIGIPDEDDEDESDDEPEETEDKGRYQSGHRIYRGGYYREDFRSDC